MNDQNNQTNITIDKNSQNLNQDNQAEVKQNPSSDKIIENGEANQNQESLNKIEEEKNNEEEKIQAEQKKQEEIKKKE